MYVLVFVLVFLVFVPCVAVPCPFRGGRNNSLIKVREEADPFSMDLGVLDKGGIVKVLEVRSMVGNIISIIKVGFFFFCHFFFSFSADDVLCCPRLLLYSFVLYIYTVLYCMMIKFSGILVVTQWVIRRGGRGCFD